MTMRWSRTYIYSIVAVFFHLSLASATTHWVSPSGNDSTGNGSASNPYATIQKAIDVSASGDLIMLKAGTYVGVGNKNLNIEDKSLLLWSETGAVNTFIDAGRDRILRFTHRGQSNEPTQQLSVHGVTFQNGYLEYGGDWNVDSPIYLADRGNLEFYDCEFKNNETKVTYFTARAPLIATRLFLYNDGAVYLKNCLFTSNKIGGGGWIQNFGGGGGGVVALNWSYLSQIDRCTFYGNQLYISATGDGSTRADLPVVVSDKIINSLIFGNSGVSNYNTDEPSAAVATSLSWSYVNPSNPSLFPNLNPFEGEPQLEDVGSGLLDPAVPGNLIDAGDPSFFHEADGSRVDIGYSSKKAYFGNSWSNALPSFTNNSFTSGTFEQWQVIAPTPGSATIENDSSAADGRALVISQLSEDVTLRSPAFICGERWRALS